MYKSCFSPELGRGGVSLIVWVIVILFVLNLLDNKDCGGAGIFSGNSGCGCGCN